PNLFIVASRQFPEPHECRDGEESVRHHRRSVRRVWLFTIAPEDWRAGGAKHVATLTSVLTVGTVLVLRPRDEDSTHSAVIGVGSKGGPRIGRGCRAATPLGDRSQRRLRSREAPCRPITTGSTTDSSSASSWLSPRL